MLAAGHQPSAGPARPRHPGDVLLDRNPAHGARESETLQPGPGARDALHLAGQGKEGPLRPHRRAGHGVDRKYLREARPQLASEPDDGTVFLSIEGGPFSPTV